ncbi:MAG: hypothetical protein PWQ63_31 [Methanolobus sp.]|jgi:hypothetical protein|nr:hypothetical protein [Methanolobus sp.]MDK2946871.1 hypothetical protein [Methanolobus sp.]
MLKPDDICSLSCFKEKEGFYDKINDIVNLNTVNIPLELEKHSIYYSPVGNYPEEPYVIICGKTPSGDSHDLFVKALKDGKSLHEACFSSIYSNMRDNLFEYLCKIGLFEYLSKIVPYWNSPDPKAKWNAIFENLDDSLASGIQLTQAFNCAILNKESSKRSSEPSKKVFDETQKNIGCMFKHFRINPNLKLIIFLDTPSKDNRFHQIDFWNRMPINHNYGFKVISITHPSRQNMDIYNHLDDLTLIKSNKRNKAIEIFENAKKTVKDLSEA